MAILFLGTPHRGSSFNTLGRIVARALAPIGSSTLLLEELAYDALPLLDMHEEFVNTVGKKLRVVNFFEQRKTLLIKLWFFQWEAFVSKKTLFLS